MSISEYRIISSFSQLTARPAVGLFPPSSPSSSSSSSSSPSPACNLPFKFQFLLPSRSHQHQLILLLSLLSAGSLGSIQCASPPAVLAAAPAGGFWNPLRASTPSSHLLKLPLHSSSTAFCRSRESKEIQSRSHPELPPSSTESSPLLLLPFH